MDLPHLNEYKFKHNFRDVLKPLCACTLEPETTFHYLLWCHFLQTEWRNLLNDIKKNDEKDSDFFNILKSLDVSEAHAHAQLGC